MSMHPRFPDWYRLVTVTPPEGVLHRRWRTVERLSQNSEFEPIKTLLALFTSDVTEASVPGQLIEEFRVDDETFPSKGNLYELRVLAGAILRQIIEAKGPGATLAALGIVCGSFGPRIRQIPERDHLNAAETFLAEQGTVIRRREKSPAAKFLEMTKEEYTQLVPAASFQSNTIPQAHEHIFALVVDLMRRISSSIASVQSAIDQQQHSIEVQDEELNLLWWLQTAFSRDLQKPFEEIDPSTATVLFPIELADLTVLVPGPSAIIAILSDAFRKLSRAVTVMPPTLGRVVNATPRGWRELISRKYDLANASGICPALLAVNKSLETDAAEDWYPVYRKASGIPADDELEMMQLSLQFYRECMFLRALRKGLS